MPVRETCDYCGDPIPRGRHSNAKYCSDAHRQEAQRQRRWQDRHWGPVIRQAFDDWNDVRLSTKEVIDRLVDLVRDLHCGPLMKQTFDDWNDGRLTTKEAVDRMVELLHPNKSPPK
ncbi:MAG: hypothetical protein J2P57_22545 [Acidimicrobiaceae bacterium]|nr:hypothetical protein [Acidimicrobiaceae bacterium]